MTTNVARIDVREALLRPDLSPVAERRTSWFVKVPRSLADGTPVPAGGTWGLDPARGLTPGSTSDPMIRALLALYARDREASRTAAPHDPNFTGPLEVGWRRLTREEAAARPYADTHCLSLRADGAMEPCPATFDAEAVDVLPGTVPPPSPPVAEPPALLSVLAAFGANRIGTSQVLRALMEHPSWLAPAGPYASAGGDLVVPKMVLYGDQARMPPGVVWVFSDRAHADRANAQLVAQGGQLGPYVEGVSGVDVFSRLESFKFEKLNVNIGSPAVETFFVGDGPGPLLGLWARAVGLEQTIARATSHQDPAMLRALRDFPGLCTFQSDDGVMVIERDGSRGVPLFTAIDCAEVFAGHLRPELRAAYQRVSAPGSAIFKVFASLPIASIFVNPEGPGVRRTLPRAVAAAG
jgi:hypothetical protein